MKEITYMFTPDEVDVEELQSSIVKIALDAGTEGYNQGVLASAELLRKTAELNPQVSETLNTCAQVLEDIVKDRMK